MEKVTTENFQNGSPGELHIRNQTSNETAWKTNKNEIKLKTQKRHIKLKEDGSYGYQN